MLCYDHTAFDRLRYSRSGIVCQLVIDRHKCNLFFKALNMKRGRFLFGEAALQDAANMEKRSYSHRPGGKSAMLSDQRECLAGRPLAEVSIISLFGAVSATVKAGALCSLIVCTHLIPSGFCHVTRRWLSRVIACLTYGPAMTFVTILGL